MRFIEFLTEAGFALKTYRKRLVPPAVERWLQQSPYRAIGWHKGQIDVTLDQEFTTRVAEEKIRKQLNQLAGEEHEAWVFRFAMGDDVPDAVIIGHITSMTPEVLKFLETIEGESPYSDYEDL